MPASPGDGTPVDPYPQPPSGPVKPEWLPDFAYRLAATVEVPGPPGELVEALRALAGKTAAKMNKPRAGARSEAAMYRRAEQYEALALVYVGAISVAEALELAEQDRGSAQRAHTEQLMAAYRRDKQARP